MRFAPLLVLLVANTISGVAWAGDLPTGGAVAAGTASFTGGANSLVVNQGSSRAVINWNSFSIGAGNTVQFVQPSASSAVLNRVVTANPSQIYGSIIANGQVFLVNPSGIYVGPGGTIHAAGIFLSTGDISNANFLGSSILFEPPPANSMINISGQLTATDRIEIASDNVRLAHSALDAPNAIEINASRGLDAGDFRFHTNSLSLDPRDVHIASDLIIAGNLTIGGNVFSGDISTGGSLSVTNGISTTGGFTLGGGTATITMAQPVGGSITVTGNLLGLTGQTSAQGSITLEGGNVTIARSAGLTANGSVAATTVMRKLVQQVGGTISLGGGARVQPSTAPPSSSQTAAPPPLRASTPAARPVSPGGMTDGAVTVRMSLVDAAPIALR